MSPFRRLVFQPIYWIALLSGRSAAGLAASYRELVNVPPRYAPLAFLASFVVLALWSFPRVISTGAVACCVVIAGKHGRAQ